MSSTIARLELGVGLVAEQELIVCMTWTLCYGQRHDLFCLRCVDVKPKANINRSIRPSEQRKSPKRIDERIYEHSRCIRTAVDSMPLFANSFARDGEVSLPVAPGPCEELTVRRCIVDENCESTCGQIQNQLS